MDTQPLNEGTCFVLYRSANNNIYNPFNVKFMKKYFSSFLMAMVAIACVTAFTACGGDDDDLPGQEPGTVVFFEPCLEFGSNQEHVKDYMSGGTWQLLEESNDYVLMYTNSNTTTTVTYSFIGTGKGLTMSTVTYVTFNAQFIISEIERRYKVTLRKDTDASQPGDTMYAGQATIGGRTIGIVAHCTSASVTVIYKNPN